MSEGGQFLLALDIYAPGTAEWHLFYFNHRDEIPSDRNHWKNGSHVHFVNWLWRLEPRVVGHD